MKDKKTKSLFDVGKKQNINKKSICDYICPCFNDYSDEEVDEHSSCNDDKFNDLDFDREEIHIYKKGDNCLD